MRRNIRISSEDDALGVNVAARFLDGVCSQWAGQASSGTDRLQISAVLELEFRKVCLERILDAVFRGILAMLALLTFLVCPACGFALFERLQ